MNRICKGRVTKVEQPKPGVKNEWDPLPDWQDALLVSSKQGEDGWQHHELFQDAVNFSSTPN